MATETVKITSNRILLKNASGVITFDSNNLYLKTASAGQFVVGGSLAAPQLWGGGGVTAIGNNGYGNKVCTQVYSGYLNSTHLTSGVTIVLPKRDNYTLGSGQVQRKLSGGSASSYFSSNQIYYINGKPMGAFHWQGLLGISNGSYAKFLYPIFEMTNTASQSVEIFLPFNTSIYNTMVPYDSATQGSSSFPNVINTNIALQWWDWNMEIIKQPQTLALAVSV